MIKARRRSRRLCLLNRGAICRAEFGKLDLHDPHPALPRSTEGGEERD